jgi:hypothetical protein
MWPYAADAERLGKSTRRSGSEKTSSANPAGCTEPWLSSMGPRSVSLGREISTRLPLQFQSLTASRFSPALGLVGIPTARIPIMSLVTTRVKKQNRKEKKRWQSSK